MGFGGPLAQPAATRRKASPRQSRVRGRLSAMLLLIRVLDIRAHSTSTPLGPGARTPSLLDPFDEARPEYRIFAVPVRGPFSIALRDRAGARRDASAARIKPDGYAHSARGLGTGGV